MVYNSPLRKQHKSDVSRAVGARMRVVRRDRQRSLKEVAEHLGVAWTMVQRYEMGDACLPLDLVCPLALYLECEPEWLAFGWLPITDVP